MAAGCTTAGRPLDSRPHQQHAQHPPQAISWPAESAAHRHHRRRLLQVHAAATSSGSAGGMLQKLARVFKEKAAQDLGRIVQGTSKTREKLGVSTLVRSVVVGGAVRRNSTRVPAPARPGTLRCKC